MKNSWWNDPLKRAEAVRKQTELARARKWPAKLAKYGITEEQYVAEIAAGNKWCVGHKAFHSRSAFSNPDKFSECKESIRVKSREHYRNLSPEAKADRIAAVVRDETPYGRRRKFLRHTYKLEPEQWDALLAAQGGVCAICKREPGDKHKFRFSVDHDHACCPGRRSCGKCIRGILCLPCNKRLAAFEEIAARTDWFAASGIYLQTYAKKRAFAGAVFSSKI